MSAESLVLQTLVLCLVLFSLSDSFSNRSISFISNEVNQKNTLEEFFNKRKSKKQETRFITLDYLSQNIGIGMEFAVPVLQIPVSKASDLNDLPSLFRKGLPPLKFNIGALILMVMVVIGALLSHLLLNYKPIFLVHFLKAVFNGWKTSLGK